MSKSKDLAIKKNQFLEKLKGGKAVAKPARKTDVSTLRRAVENSGRNKLVFSLDATGSREAAWKVATEITLSMFETVPDKIEVSLASRL